VVPLVDVSVQDDNLGFGVGGDEFFGVCGRRNITRSLNIISWEVKRVEV
jgi:hypothetical protein